jgi:hypothetical protein
MPVVRGDSLGFPGALSLVVEGRARAPLLSRLVSMVCSRPAEGDASLEMRFVVDLDPGAENDHGRDAIRFAQGASVVLSQGLADAGSPLFEGVVTARGMECFEAGAPQVWFRAEGHAHPCAESQDGPLVLTYGDRVSSLSLAQNLAAGGTGDPAAHPGPVSGWLDVPGWFMPAPGADLVLRGTGSLFDGPLHAVAAEFTLDVTAVRTRVRVHRD